VVLPPAVLTPASLPVLPGRPRAAELPPARTPAASLPAAPRSPAPAGTGRANWSDTATDGWPDTRTQSRSDGWPDPHLPSRSGTRGDGLPDNRTSSFSGFDDSRSSRSGGYGDDRTDTFADSRSGGYGGDQTDAFADLRSGNYGDGRPDDRGDRGDRNGRDDLRTEGWPSRAATPPPADATMELPAYRDQTRTDPGRDFGRDAPRDSGRQELGRDALRDSGRQELGRDALRDSGRQQLSRDALRDSGRQELGRDALRDSGRQDFGREAGRQEPGYQESARREPSRLQEAFGGAGRQEPARTEPAYQRTAGRQPAQLSQQAAAFQAPASDWFSSPSSHRTADDPPPARPTGRPDQLNPFSQPERPAAIGNGNGDRLERPAAGRPGWPEPPPRTAPRAPGPPPPPAAPPHHAANPRHARPGLAGTPEIAPITWHTRADAGWQAARRVSEAPPEEATTHRGLPKRSPMAHLVPGSAAAADSQAPVVARRPESVRSVLTEYQRGVRNGRHQYTPPGPQPTRDANHVQER
jgi:hypothetical protein